MKTKTTYAGIEFQARKTSPIQIDIKNIVFVAPNLAPSPAHSATEINKQSCQMKIRATLY